MELRYYQVISNVNGNDVKENAKIFLGEISKELGEECKPLDLEALKKEEVRFIFVGSGGSENYFLEIFDEIKDRPIYILSCGTGNSLAASMEILTFLQQKGVKGEILHGDGKTVANRIKALVAAYEAKKYFDGAKFGVLGKPSDWLISSAMNEPVLKEKLNASLVHIPMSELLTEYNKHEYEPNEWTEALINKNYNREEIEKALYVYGAFDRIVKKYDLKGITVRCFDLLDTVKTTGCLGLAILNAQGIYAACEGDVPSLISMAILGELTHKPIFMCNPSRIDMEKKVMIFAHCTLPLNMPYTYDLTTHYESGIGVAIAGSLKEEDFTIFKTSANLDRYFTDKGQILKNLRLYGLCRSQILVKFDSYDYFLQKPIHNHHLICLGDETAKVDEFFRLIK